MTVSLQNKQHIMMHFSIKHQTLDMYFGAHCSTHLCAATVIHLLNKLNLILHFLALLNV